MDYRNDYSTTMGTGSVLRGGLSSAASVSAAASHAGLFYYSEGMSMKPPDLSSVAAVKTSAGSGRTSAAVPPVPHAAQSTSVSGGGGGAAAAAAGSSAKSSSSSFAAALRQLAKQAGVPTSQVNTESSESRGSSSASSASSPRESRASHSRSGDALAPCDPSNGKSSGLPATRTRSPPPVVTIAPTLSFNAVHYQDSRKTQGYDRPGHLHSLPANGSFSGGISTGLSGLHLPPAVNLSLPATNSVPLDYLRGHPELQTSAVSPYGHLGALRPEELLYTGLRNSLPTSTTPVTTSRPDEGGFQLLPSSLNSPSPYHDSLWVSSRASGLVPGRPAQEYLLGPRASPYLPYRADLIQQAVLEQSALAGQVHPSLYQHSLAAAQHTLRLEEQLYLERCGLLRSPSLMIPPQSYSPFTYPASPYLGYRYPIPLVAPSETTPTSEHNFSRANSAEETKDKEKTKEEEKAAMVVSPTVKYPAAEASSLAARGNSPSVGSVLPRRDRVKSKEKDRKRDRESRKGTISLPSESSVKNQAKIQAVPPLNAQADTCRLSSSPVQPPLLRCEDDANQCAGISAQFSQSALEAMAMLQRNTLDEPRESCEESPLDLSESVKEVVVPTFRPCSPEEPVVSLLDVRERHYRERNQENDTDDEDDAQDVECNITVPIRLRYQLQGESMCKRKPAEEQSQFLQMFDLVTHSQKEDVKLSNCEKRHRILRDATPEPVEVEEEDLEKGPCSRLDTSLSKLTPLPISGGKREFFLQLGMEVSSDSHKRDVESSWSLIKADRLRRCCSPCRLKRSADAGRASEERPVVKVPRLAVNPEKKQVDWAELKQSTRAFEKRQKEDQNEVSKLATEAAFWLRHLTVPLARALTPLSPTSLPSHKEASETHSEPELVDRWSRLETVMSMYISYNQEVSTEIDFLKEHCEKLHLQLAEGQANLSRLCLTLSSLLDKQRQTESERQSLLESANRLEETITSLQIQ